MCVCEGNWPPPHARPASPRRSKFGALKKGRRRLGRRAGHVPAPGASHWPRADLLTSLWTPSPPPPPPPPAPLRGRTDGPQAVGHRPVSVRRPGSPRGDRARRRRVVEIGALPPHPHAETKRGWVALHAHNLSPPLNRLCSAGRSVAGFGEELKSRDSPVGVRHGQVSTVRAGGNPRA